MRGCCDSMPSPVRRPGQGAATVASMVIMLSIIQRVSSGRVRVDGVVQGEIGLGYVMLAGYERGDGGAEIAATVAKLRYLRAFPGRTPMDRDIVEVGGAVLLISQFTLAGRLSKGRRPSFDRAEQPELAQKLYGQTAAALRSEGMEVALGVFGAQMQVALVNEGPVTFVLTARDGKVVDWTGP